MVVTEGLEPGLRRVYEYWQRIKQDKIAPTRREIRPEDIPPSMLPRICIIDVMAGQPHRFRFRLVGTEIITEYGGDPTGKFLDEIDLGHMTEQIVAEYENVTSTAEPISGRWRYAKNDKRSLNYEHVMMPLSDDGITVTHLLCAAMMQGFSAVKIGKDR